MVVDWDAWMKEHHIKLGGNSDDRGSDESEDICRVRRSKVAKQGVRDGRQAGHSHI